MASEWEETTELELTIKDNFRKLANGFEQVEQMGDAQQASLLKDFTVVMQDCKRLIKDFEREARTDGMPPKILSDKKRQLVQELNMYIALKKTKASQLQARSSQAQQGLLPPSSSGIRDDPGNGADDVRNDKLIEMGRREIKETDKALERARKVVQETITIGAETAASLNDQTKQMEGILNDLDDITFNMQKAQKVIAQITKGLVTDKCILCLLFLVVLLAIGAIVLSIIDFGGGDSAATTEAEVML